jgi:CRP-like cAMP-binding protein
MPLNSTWLTLATSTSWKMASRCVVVPSVSVPAPSTDHNCYVFQVNECSSGDVIGELALLHNVPRSATVVSRTGT